MAGIAAFPAAPATAAWWNQGCYTRHLRKLPTNAIPALSFSVHPSANVCRTAHGHTTFRNAVNLKLKPQGIRWRLNGSSWLLFAQPTNAVKEYTVVITLCMMDFLFIWHLAGENIALGKSSLQSSTLWNYSADLAVDSNGDTCSFTPRSSEQRWWQVHLGDPHANVQSVAITISPGSYQKFTIFIIGAYY